MRLVTVNTMKSSHRGAALPEYVIMIVVVVLGLVVFSVTLLLATQRYFDNRSDRFNDQNPNRGPLIPNQ